MQKGYGVFPRFWHLVAISLFVLLGGCAQFPWLDNDTDTELSNTSATDGDGSKIYTGRDNEQTQVAMPGLVDLALPEGVIRDTECNYWFARGASYAYGQAKPTSESLLAAECLSLPDGQRGDGALPVAEEELMSELSVTLLRNGWQRLPWARSFYYPGRCLSFDYTIYPAEQFGLAKGYAIMIIAERFYGRSTTGLCVE